VSAAENTEVIIPVLSGQLGEFTITDFGDVPTRKENGRVLVTRWYTITSFTTGDHLVPAPTVHYRLAGEGLQQAEGDEVLVGVTSVLAKDAAAADIRDIKPPEELPFDWRPYGIAAGAVVLVGLLGAGPADRRAPRLEVHGCAVHTRHGLQGLGDMTHAIVAGHAAHAQFAGDRRIHSQILGPIAAGVELNRRARERAVATRESPPAAEELQRQAVIPGRP